MSKLYEERVLDLEDRVTALEARLGDVGDGSIADRLEALEKRLSNVTRRLGSLSHLMPLK